MLSDISLVLSKPVFNSLILFLLISNPKTFLLVLHLLKNIFCFSECDCQGNPTYPSPNTAIAIIKIWERICTITQTNS